MKDRGWVKTEQATIERCKELLAAGGSPVTLRWRRLDRQGKGGGWEPVPYDTTVALVGVTAKRLKVRDCFHTEKGLIITGPVYVANPANCRFAEWRENVSPQDPCAVKTNSVE